jgi:hypothetical protein
MSESGAFGDDTVGVVIERMTVSEALLRHQGLLPTQTPELWENLRPPATDDEIADLRRAITPYALCPEYEHLLRWRNGAVAGPGSWWPILDCGPLLSAADAAEHYRRLVEMCEEWQWHRSWLPITHGAWAQVGIELGEHGRGVIVDGSFPDPPVAIAPSLAAVLHATCEVVANVPDFDRPRRLKSSFDAEIKAILAPIYAAYGATPAIS